MIIYTPLDIPKIEPNDWEEWWNVWNNHAEPVYKKRANHNHFHTVPLWKGFDLFRLTDNLKLHTYDAVLAPQVPVITHLVKQIKEHCIFEPWLIRVVENLIHVGSHSDSTVPNIYEFRSVLWNTYPDPIWKFTHKNESRYLTLPEESNSFYYLDYPVTHTGIYNPLYSKGLLQVYGKPKQNLTEIVNNSVEKYKDLAWTE